MFSVSRSPQRTRTSCGAISPPPSEARRILAQEPGAWAPIKARLNLKDDAELEILRKRYLEGLPKRPIAEEAADARILFDALAKVGGKDLIGEATEFDPKLFFDPETGG